jgi:hypothetical protein
LTIAISATVALSVIVPEIIHATAEQAGTVAWNATSQIDRNATVCTSWVIENLIAIGRENRLARRCRLHVRDTNHACLIKILGCGDPGHQAHDTRDRKRFASKSFY